MASTDLALRSALAALVLAASVTGCVPANFGVPPTPREGVPSLPTPAPEPATPAPAPSLPTPPPAPVPLPPPVRTVPPVGAAGQALLQESRAHQAAGRYGQAAASIERALRIEPRQPVLWLELGTIRLREADYGQAETCGRKALSLAAGDAGLETRAERLIAEARRNL